MPASVTVCRGCCCGTVEKHPDFDHEEQLATLRSGVSRVVVADCLGSCDRSNVVVVSPDPAARRAGARPVWLSRMLTVAATQAVLDWVADGGPGVADLPPALRARQLVGASAEPEATAG
ncbi:(2Fe-2S) ferredoxin domain-containing protein [Nocardioides limicola]|uniref:(2Fe-2S) ferredoxin domain-containing protein n=1 Tax=Nocardioides limicola TaxID=2803368 RepID=UPI00193C37AC|nr:(2Fe-2S) ferredoxin domain-containing protein [Nocardioides sp. DJM-14]